MAKAHLETDPETGDVYIWLDLIDTTCECPDCGRELVRIPCPECKVADLPDCPLCDGTGDFYECPYCDR